MRVMPGLGLALIASVFAGPWLRGQNATVAYPKNYHVAFENAWVEAIRVHYGPHERVGVHDHSAYPTVYVYLNDAGPVRFSHEETPAFEATRPPTKAGAFRVSPGRAERHSVENLSDTSSEFLRVELKKVPLGSGIKEFRGEAPRGELRATDALEYTSPQVSVERIVCVGTEPCAVKGSERPSLLIALSAVDARGPAARQMQVGDVRWVAEKETVALAPIRDGSVQVLRVLMGEAR